MDFKTMDWTLAEQGKTVRRKQIFVSIRSSTIQVNSNFMKKYDASQLWKYVRVQLNENHHCLLLEFMSQPAFADQLKDNPMAHVGVFELLVDGGSPHYKRGKVRGRPHRGRIIGCSHMLNKNPWLKSISQESDVNRRRFEPEETHDANIFFIRCIPSFEHECIALFCQAPSGSVGIYSFEDKDGNILYIGMGDLRARYNYHMANKDWAASTYKWSLIDSRDKRIEAEKHHLRIYMAQHGGRLPPYNILYGTSPSSRIEDI